MKVISLWRPWGLAVILGLKEIETRTHRNFQGLAGQRIAIHNTVKWDSGAMDVMNPYIPKDPFDHKRVLFIDRMRPWDSKAHPPGAIIGTVYAEAFTDLDALDATRALCPITQNRFGLVLNMPRQLKRPIVTPGSMGIWEYEVEE